MGAKQLTMDNQTELLLDYQEQAILALRAEVKRLTEMNEALTTTLLYNEHLQ